MAKTTVIKKTLPLHKKLKNIRVDDAFDYATIALAENTLKNLEHFFMTEIKKEYVNLIANFAMTRPETILPTDIQKIADSAFSLKSQAGMAGLHLVSEIAKSLYELCSGLKDDISPEVHKVIKLHVDAIIDVYEKKFKTSDTSASQHLVRGLNALAKKFA